MTNTFAVLRLLPMSDRDKDTEILALRHQIAMLERQLGKQKARFTPVDRAFLAALLHRLPPQVMRRLRLLIRPDTILRWHRDLIARRHAARSKPKRAGRPPTVRSIRVLVLRLVRENPHWGYRRVHGELLVLGVKVAASTVWEILKDAGIDPAPERASSTWADFLRSQAGALLACDFFETVTLSGARMYVLAVIEHVDRRIRILGATTYPTASWVVQAAKNLVIDLEDAGCRTRLLIRDRDGKYPQLFDTVLRDAGIEVVLSGIRMPRTNSIMERWVQTCRRELLDRTLVWNQRHLLHALREFERYYNEHRPHQGIAGARPHHPLPPPITDPGQIALYRFKTRRGPLTCGLARRKDPGRIVDCVSSPPLSDHDSGVRLVGAPRSGQSRQGCRDPPPASRTRCAASAGCPAQAGLGRSSSPRRPGPACARAAHRIKPTRSA
jgi:transposase InsO family protein